ncbi:DMT family transporter [Tianweitania sediminis]|uniref:DMT family transporter n=1 Tax=Tianweitania sediminis TaxID=1502156 RepID=A0A8J7RL29_9HYPH|nr:DMT family transporter [Tianweitania sediminis]MBP0440366.1 DMT family transporter [Tianweitania sediminis]
MSSGTATVQRFGKPGATEFILLGVLSTAWGSSYMFTKVAVAEFSPISLVAIRIFIAAIIMCCILTARNGWPRLTRRDLAAFAFLGFIANALPLTLIATSVSYVDSSVPAVTMALVPLITACFGILRKEYPDWRNVLGIIVGLAGILALFGPDAFTSFGSSAKGLLAASSAAVVFAASLFGMALVRHHNSFTTTTLILIFATFWMIPVALLVDGLPPHLPTHAVMGAVLVLATLNTAMGNLLLFALVSRAGPAFTSYNNYLAPVAAVTCGVAFLGEALTLRAVVGIILVLLGVAISTLRRRAGA